MPPQRLLAPVVDGRDAPASATIDFEQPVPNIIPANMYSALQMLQKAIENTGPWQVLPVSVCV